MLDESEGRTWWLDRVRRRETMRVPPSATPVSDRAFDMIVGHELARQGPAAPNPSWPGGEAGVTFGIGYDLGYTSSAQLTADWCHRIEEMWIHRLEGKIGIRGPAAVDAIDEMNRRVMMDITMEDSIWVFRWKTLPRHIGVTEAAFGNSWRLGPDCLGALVSLVWRRGARFMQGGNEFSEMAAIADAMHEGAFARVPDLLNVMARHYPAGSPSAQRCRDEAELFADGLPSNLH